MEKGGAGHAEIMTQFGGYVAGNLAVETGNHQIFGMAGGNWQCAVRRTVGLLRGNRAWIEGPTVADLSLQAPPRSQRAEYHGPLLFLFITVPSDRTPPLPEQKTSRIRVI
ncbi:hypothetical protein [Neorhizobium petrolearium]|uniref:hypothetical protein n=1 Tax=Neorhizobium petrolearium TaxID=515361 RepID=UPI003F16792E